MYPNSMKAKIVNYFLYVNRYIDFFSAYKGFVKYMVIVL